MSVLESDEPETPEYHDEPTLAFAPIGGTWYFRINATGQVAEVSVRVLCADDWALRPEADDPSWRPLTFGGLVIAVKALC
jgi:hypothetical protein